MNGKWILGHIEGSAICRCLCYIVTMQSRYVFVSDETNIHFNLALEKYLIEELDPKSTILFLWRNSPVVVIGRYQNPWEECRLSAMEDNNVVLARRCSGGGAVYQDLGNICFTIISPVNEGDKARNFKVVVEALDMMGIKAQVSGRNDVVVDGRKVSGSAFQTTKGRFCHHGTMLVSTDLSCLPNYLTPNKRKLESHGVRSVASRVANLVEFSPNATTEMFASCMEKAFENEFCGSTNESTSEKCPTEHIGLEKTKAWPSLRQSFEMFSSRDWNLGKSPTFTDRFSGRFELGCVTFYLVVKKGVVSEASVSSDTLVSGGVERLEQEIVGLPYDAVRINEKANAVSDPFVSGALALLSSLMVQDSQ